MTVVSVTLTVKPPDPELTTWFIASAAPPIDDTPVESPTDFVSVPITSASPINHAVSFIAVAVLALISIIA
jgi:hypothetical protein